MTKILFAILDAVHGILDVILQYGWIAVVAVIYAESGLMIGFFLPGDSLLFTAGALVQQGVFAINIHVFVWLLWLAAMAGNSTGYWFGRKVGRRLFVRENSRLFHQKNLQRAEAFYEKHGPKTIIIAMFIPIVRTFTPIVAGISKMPYRRFLLFNIIGALLWTVLITYLGYYVGASLREAGFNIEATAILIILLSLSPGIYHLLRDGKQRRAMWEGTKREVRILLRKEKR